MKVTVCFGPVRVIVPCGDGEILVKDLIRQAIHRYKKATGKGSDNWVSVQCLQTERDGGILDPDDRLLDVADDREQIIAKFGEGEGPHHGGDGASGSSVGTSSPDIFHGGGTTDKFPTDIEVTNEQIASGVPAHLQVRRGSEPALNQLVPTTNGVVQGPVAVNNTDASKRWSAAPLISEPRDRPLGRKDDGRNGHYRDKWSTHVEEEENINHLNRHQSNLNSHFTRDGSNRLSMQFFGDNGYRWWEAAEKTSSLHTRMQSLSLPREHKRKEPVGQANTGPNSPQHNHHHHNSNNMHQSLRSSQPITEEIILDTMGGAMLGLHVVPDYDTLGREVGLVVQGVEPGGRVDSDGRLQVNDRIVDINGNNLIDKPFNIVQEIFRDSLRCPELRLKVVKARGNKKVPPPVYPKPNGIVNSTPTHSVAIAHPATIENDSENHNGLTRSEMGSLVRRGVVVGLQSANTRRLGRKVEISLVKGQYGLGFSVTTRDNPASGNCPIYIKNILPKGAAVEDGRLRPGDRLLAVDGVEVTGKSQGDVVAILRNVPPGNPVTLLVSRQQDTYQEHAPETNNNQIRITPSPNVNINSTNVNNTPTATPVITTSSTGKQIINHPEKESHIPKIVNNTQSTMSDSVDDSCVYPWRQREILTLDIPVHDSEKAGLGVSVKGKTSSSNNSGQTTGSSVDLGIFVKSVIHGGAASRDGRLKMNDQLLSVNGISLLGQNNTDAMETLRRALIRSDGPVPGHITLSVARKLQANSPRTDSVSSLLTDSSANTETFGGKSEESSGNLAETSATSDNSDSTVIFMPPYKNNSKVDGSVVSGGGSSSGGSAVRNHSLERPANQPQNINNLANPLRNESYYRATHQTTLMLNGTGRLNATLAQPTESPIAEDEPLYSPHGLRRSSETEKAPMSPQQRGSTSSTQTAGDVTYASQLSLDDQAAAFSRDAFGRQSMSEKRHAALDAKNTDTYQRNKKARDEREKMKNRLVRVNSAESIAKIESNTIDVNKQQLGPSLGMKKSSSLESLQTMVQEMQMAEDVGNNRSNTGVRVVRGRGCNESFRAAVDRLAPHNLDTVTEDDDSPLGRQRSLNTSIDSKASKGKTKRQSLLKGIGSMFRFGKHRKDSTVGTNMSGPAEDSEKEQARRAAKEEQERIQEQYRRLMQRQHDFRQDEDGIYSNANGGSNNGANHHGDIGSSGGGNNSRTERINQLRAEHQRRHAERNRVYPLEDREERYEHHIKKRLENDYDTGGGGAMNRPGSRLGIADPSTRFSHYVNYHEIQQHLNRRQQHYHSQRSAPREQIHRPVSNFYEYESVQAMLRAQTIDPNSNSLPRGTRDQFANHQGVMTNNNINGKACGLPYIGSSGSQRYTYYSSGGTATSIHHTANGYSSNIYGTSGSGAGSIGSHHRGGPFVTHVTVNETTQHGK